MINITAPASCEEEGGATVVDLTLSHTHSLTPPSHSHSFEKRTLSHSPSISALCSRAPLRFSKTRESGRVSALAGARAYTRTRERGMEGDVEKPVAPRYERLEV